MSAAISVVIAEDDPQIAEIQRRFIERVEGFEVRGIAHNTRDATDLVDVMRPDLLLLDIQFPDGSGLELLRRLRTDNSATDVVMITAAKEVDTLTEALRWGVFDYILKPVVFDRLQQALGNYRAHRQRLLQMQSLSQQEVDGLLPRSGSGGGATRTAPAAEPLPKGIDTLTLEKVRRVFRAKPSASLSAEQVGEQIGSSRTTARRYLEYLVGTRELSADVAYGSVGRPERQYRLPR
ncbi:transcriptional regulatory protein [Marinobacterium nitratireducens]|uniref:Transcriptional regulatory protein n=1 Tax=Marinobacterium nitratireducens TaxID=518897 RepID=A0A917ZHC0_9GAMM|nr:response regulator [Marinobacterium nitratireducens]GGO81999.1 transcriptional regulatory protein [Marinobacterium nitratireducens]